MKRTLLSLLLLFGAMLAVHAADLKPAEEEVIEGKLIEKPWTKTTQSFCAQGSHYFVLQRADDEVVLSYHEDLTAHIEEFVGKQVKVMGSFELKEIDISDDNMQHPEGDGDVFRCEVFNVTRVFPAAGEQMIFSGKLIEKPWTKSTQSYCAQGSDYLVLVSSTGEEWVLSAGGKIERILRQHLDQFVDIRGALEVREIEAPDDGMQHPVGEVFTCEVLQVSGVTPIGMDNGGGKRAEEMLGTLVKKPWTKTTQSFCAQGSEYLVLDIDGEEIVLAYEEDMLPELEKLVGKSIRVQGKTVEREIDISDDGMQHPMGEGDTFICTVFQLIRFAAE